MRSHEDVEQVHRDGWFVRAAGVVGDLGSPFYAEERQRDVWNEASAVGLQVVLWLGTATATVMVWLGGASALPYAVGVVSLVGVASLVTLAYAHALGVRVEDAHLLRLRLVPFTALLVLFLLGAVREAPSGGFVGGFTRGLVIGSTAALLWLVWAGWRGRRRGRPAKG
jgi:hypothetical protein